MIKMACLSLRRSALFNNPALPCDLVLQFHDEVVLQVPSDTETVQLVLAQVRHSMEQVYTASKVPFPVQIQIGDRLGSCLPSDEWLTQRAAQEEQERLYEHDEDSPSV